MATKHSSNAKRAYAVALWATLIALIPSFAQARWIDPERGRWISREPLGLDGPNLYEFAHSQPLRFVDTDGLSSYIPPVPGQSTEDFCKNDPCKGKVVWNDAHFGGGEDCDEHSCHSWADPFDNDKPHGYLPGDAPHASPPGPFVGSVPVVYGPGHTGVYDPMSGCAASCSAGDSSGGPPSGRKRVVIHHPLCHPRGNQNSPWQTPEYWY